MTLFWKCIAYTLIAAVLIIALEKHEKDAAIAISVLVCTILFTSAVEYLEPVFGFLKELEHMSNLKEDFLITLLKVVGIGLTTEISDLICIDTGNTALGKSIRIIGNAAILYVALPVFKALINCIQQILGGV